jgi:hypothetical protein
MIKAMPSFGKTYTTNIRKTGSVGAVWKKVKHTKEVLGTIYQKPYVLGRKCSCSWNQQASFLEITLQVPTNVHYSTVDSGQNFEAKGGGK